MLKLFRRQKAQAPVITQRGQATAKRWSSATAHSGQKARVIERYQETDAAVRLVLQLDNGDGLSWQAGQHLICEFQINGQRVRRPYSICSAESAAMPEICCKRIDQGLVSNYVNQQLQPGDEIWLKGAAGHFVLGDKTRGLVFVAAGSGITPVISLIETALQQQPERSIQLVYASRNEASIIFKLRLNDLARQYDAFHVVHVLSQPESDWAGESGRLDGEALERLVSLRDGQDVYLCGPQALMTALEAHLLNGGLDVQVHCEAFTPAARPSAQQPSEPQLVHFKASGQQLTQQPGQSILEAALESGITVDFSCTVGGCAACKLKLESGQVIMNEPNCLSDAERAQGYILACSAYATETVVIDA